MTLSQLRDYIRAQGTVSLALLVTHFNKDPETLRGMLSLLVRKGCLVCENKTPACGQTCLKCNPIVFEYYKWV